MITAHSAGEVRECGGWMWLVCLPQNLWNNPPYGSWRIIPGLGSVVENHGDRFRPQDLKLWDAFQMAVYGL